MVLLLGIIFIKWKVCLNIFLNGFKEFWIIFVFLEIIKKLINVFILFFIILGIFFFCSIKLIMVIKVIKIVGVLVILIKKFNRFFMVLIF